MPNAYCPICLRTWPKLPGKPCPVDGTPLQSLGTVRGLISGRLLIGDGMASIARSKLARGGDNPYHAAIEFLTERGFRSGDRVTITGTRTRHQGKTVFVVHKATGDVKVKGRGSATKMRSKPLRG